MATAAITKVRLCNMALSHIGATPIEDFTEKTKEASQCRLWYDYSRLQVLAAYNWSFARKRLTLACHGDDAPDSWAYRYQYPSDCVKARWITNPFDNTGIGAPFVTGSDLDLNENASNAIPFEVEMSTDGTKCIVTNEQCPELVYTFDQDNPAFFSPHFVDTTAWLMGARMAFAITGKRSLASDCENAYHAYIRMAGAVDANEAVSKPPREAEWIRGRN
jgi:hypothetical protein